MTGSWARTRASERIGEICAAQLDATALRRGVLDAMRGVVEFDAFVWLSTDPVTTVGVAPFARVPCLPELPALIKAKYATGINRWTSLAGAGSPVGLLRDAVGGDLVRSRVWREVMSRYAVGDVASVVFADRFGCWGFLDLWRDDRREPFSGADAEFLAHLAPSVATALRLCQSRAFVEVATPHRHEHGPVVLTLDGDLRIIGRTSASKAWLERLLPPVPNEQAVPASVYNVAAQLLAAEDGVDDHPASARVHLADGFWLTVRAARFAPEMEPRRPGTSGGVLAGAGPLIGVRSDGAVGGPTLVVTIEETSAAERLELFARTFGLTPREDELLGLLAVGGDTRAIARQMAVSELTVQDHLKSIFGKTGTHDRVMVLSRALGTRRGLAPEDRRSADGDRG
ncbi:MAG TPA: helix-turn-helix transcriptional regulator [Nakamurella sp.]|nr:helix-turn-helix transcriptional regulator [Nakamurella sp.]